MLTPYLICFLLDDKVPLLGGQDGGLERGGVGRGGAEAVARAAEGPTRPQSPAHLRPHNHLLSPLCIIIVF